MNEKNIKKAPEKAPEEGKNTDLKWYEADGVASRAIAYRVLARCDSSGSYSNLALDAALDRSSLSDEDKRFCTRLVYGTVERRITLDYLLSKYVSREMSGIDREALVILRMALYQIMYMDRVPDHAAVDLSVVLAKKYCANAAPFVNAVLRTLCREKDKLQGELPQKGECRYLSVNYGVSDDICSLLVRDYGYERAQSILCAMSDVPGITVRVNTLIQSRDALASRLHADPGRLSPHALCLHGKCDPEYIEGGRYFVQDEASQLCAAAVGAKEGERVLDCCACPGGKSFSMAMDMNNKGELFSCDLHESKLSLVKSGAARLGITIIKALAKDATVYDETLGIFDRVLCDVPCSGIGVMAKKPEIRHKTNRDFEKLPTVQSAIINCASRYLRDGGRLVYSTCTLNKKENEDVVTEFLSSHPDFHPVDSGVGILSGKNGMTTLLPDEYGCDGFFVAVLEKKRTAGAVNR